MSQDGCMSAASQACTCERSSAACHGQSPGRAERGRPSTPAGALAPRADVKPHSIYVTQDSIYS